MFNLIYYLTLIVGFAFIVNRAIKIIQALREVKDLKEQIRNDQIRNANTLEIENYLNEIKTGKQELTFDSLTYYVLENGIYRKEMRPTEVLHLKGVANEDYYSWFYDYVNNGIHATYAEYAETEQKELND